MVGPLRRLCGLDRMKDPYTEMIEATDTRQLVHMKRKWKRYLPRLFAYTFIMAILCMFLIEVCAVLIDYAGNATPKLLDTSDDLSLGVFAMCGGFLIGITSMYSVLDNHLQKRLDEAEEE